MQSFLTENWDFYLTESTIVLEGREFTLYGITAESADGKKEKYEALSTNRSVVEGFLKKLKENTISIDVLKDIVDDFLVEMTGVVRGEI